MSIFIGKIANDIKIKWYPPVFDRLTEDEKQLVFDIVNGDTDLFGHQDLYEKLYEYYVFETNQMPYGTAKARDGDPDDWILNQLTYELESF